MGSVGGHAMKRPQWLLLLLWACALAIAAPTGPTGGNVQVVDGLELGEASGDVERGGDAATLLVEIGEAQGVTKDDGCSKAYDKFKANIDKMTGLKDKAEKKVADAEKKAKDADAKAKRCDEDLKGKETKEKDAYKKETMKKKIDAEAKKEFEKKESRR